jgi:hypothetical protein
MCKDFTPCAANQYVSTNSAGAMICKTIPNCSGTNQFLTFQSNTFVCGQVSAPNSFSSGSIFGGGGAAGSYGNGNQSGNNTTGNSAGDR